MSVLTLKPFASALFEFAVGSTFGVRPRARKVKGGGIEEEDPTDDEGDGWLPPQPACCCLSTKGVVLSMGLNSSSEAVAGVGLFKRSRIVLSVDWTPAIVVVNGAIATQTMAA
jgi:hypothetical protein